jgi:hypothetical protein
MTAGEVRCPECGGTSLKTITPSYLECISETQVGVVPPGAHGNPHPLPAMGSCGHRFHVPRPASAASPCFCGRDSIGSCLECSRRICGLHGSGSGDFLCGDCVSVRRRAKEEAKAQAFQEAVAGVRALSSPLASAEQANYRLPDGLDGLQAEGENRGFQNLIGLTWTDGKSRSEPGALDWQLVHHFRHRSREQQPVRRLFRQVWEEQTVYEDRWTAYAHYCEGGRLCGAALFTAAELVRHWRHLSERAYGSVFQDLRWAAPIALPVWPKGASPVLMPLDAEESLYGQLEKQLTEAQARSWVGLMWIDGEGLRNRVVAAAVI